MTVSSSIEVTNKQGIHARPSSMIVKLAMGFDAEITISNEASGVDANAKSPLEVMMLNAPCGTSLMIRAEGAEAQDAVDALVALINSGFDEED